MLSEHVRTMLVNEALEGSYSPRGMSASTITSCDRLTWYYVKGLVEDSSLPNASSLERMNDGFIHQDKFVGQLERLKGCEVLGTEIWGSLGSVRFRVDVRIKWKGRIWNIEYKSMGPWNFQKFREYGIESLPHYYGQCQVMIGGFPKIPLIVYAKDVATGHHWDEVVRPDLAYIEEIRVRGESFRLYNMLKDPPPRPYEMNSIPCSGCPARIMCWYSVLRHAVASRVPLKPEEIEKARRMLDEMARLGQNVDRYNLLYESLYGYLEILHSRYGVRRLRLPGVASYLYGRTQEQVDKDYVRTILTKNERNRALFSTRSEVLRISIKWEEI